MKERRGYLFVGMEAGGYACLKALLKAGWPPDAVLTLDERHREEIVAFRSFRDLEEGSIPFHYVAKLNSRKTISLIQDMAPALIVTAFWSELLSQEILSLPPLGCIGLHGTKLPKHRGRAPIPWSIFFGLRRGGMTLFRLSAEADVGVILSQSEYPIGPDEYASQVYDRSAACAAALLVEALPRLLAGDAFPEGPPVLKLDYWRKREPADGFIDWWMTADRIYDWVRALSRPFPGAYGIVAGRRIIVWRAAVASTYANLPPGAMALSEEGLLVVGTGCGCLEIHELEDESVPMSGGEFLLRYGAMRFYV